MATLYRYQQEGLPPIVVIDERELSVVQAMGHQQADEAVVVLFPDPSVAYAFRHFRGSSIMLGTAVCRSIARFFGRINRGHIQRQRNI